MQELLARPPRHLFFTGKGGVGKTSVACAAAIGLADRGRRVLLVSTDPASNLDEVLETALGTTPTPVTGVAGLLAMNLDPVAAAQAYRERLVAPYRGLLPDAAIRSIEEQLSGACTVEIAAFDEFSQVLAADELTAAFDHVVFDTAPTGHTLRLLELPATWSTFLDVSAGGASCLGPLSGLQGQRALYAAARSTLADPARTIVILVSRPDASALAEAERSGAELVELGIANQRLVINGVFTATDRGDAIAVAMERVGRQALVGVPERLRLLAGIELPLQPHGLIGARALRAWLAGEGVVRPPPRTSAPDALPGLEPLLAALGAASRGVVMTMGKGGVGKTGVAATIARELASRGHRVHLTTTDPAATAGPGAGDGAGLRVSRIDPSIEVARYIDEVMTTAGAGLDEQGRALLVEELRSPCTEEVAVFRAFARLVDEGEDEVVVIDTAPTGHTLLLLDAAEAYHREVSRSTAEVPVAVRRLLPRLRDPGFTRIVLVTLAEATPVHEAAALQRDLQRAGIEPFAWVINQSLAGLPVTDPGLRSRQAGEARYHVEVAELAARVAVISWHPKESNP